MTGACALVCACMLCVFVCMCVSAAQTRLILYLQFIINNGFVCIEAVKCSMNLLSPVFIGSAIINDRVEQPRKSNINCIRPMDSERTTHTMKIFERPKWGEQNGADG